MSIKQSKIFNFFQRKPNVSKNSSPSADKDQSFNGGEKVQNLSTPSASGDVIYGTKRNSSSASKHENTPINKKRCVENLEDRFEDDFPEAALLDKIDDSAQKDVDKDLENKTQESRPPKKRKRIVIMNSSDEDEADIDKDDDVQDTDYNPGKDAKEAPSEDEYDEEDEGLSDEESLDNIKEKLKEKFMNRSNNTPSSIGKSTFTPITKTPNRKSDVKYSLVNKENNSPAYSPLNNSGLKNRLSQFSSPKMNNDVQENESKDISLNSGRGTIDFPHLSYPFLQENKIKDKNGRRPDHPEYDCGTLYVPENHLVSQTPGQHQWWKLKCENFDTVLFFKMGKFYELFHMDAVLGVEKLGLVYMKHREIAHVGFPEIGFKKYADQLVDLGYKVARIEQTETPAMMETRCKTMARPTTKFDKVVRREICQVYSRGTLMGSNCTESYLTAISGGINDRAQIQVGVCFIDTAIGTINLSKFTDDTSLSKLETLLAVYPPSEILYDRSRTHASIVKVIEKFSGTRKSASLITFPNAKKALKTVIDQDYFEVSGKISQWPTEFLLHVDESDPLGQTPHNESEYVLSAFGAIVGYLQGFLIDQYILSIKKVANILPIDLERHIESNCSLPKSSSMILDNKTIRNLDLVSDIGAPSMFMVLDKTQTFMGKRLLKQWICSPLLRVADIRNRQIALDQFTSKRSLLEVIRLHLKGMPDLEKIVSMIHATGIKMKGDHPEARAVYFDQDIYAKKKVERLVKCLENFGTALKMFASMQEELGSCNSKLLKGNFLFNENGGQLPNINQELAFFNEAFDRKTAMQHGKILPKKGVDEDYDKSKEMQNRLENDVNAYLRQQKRYFSSDLKYFGNGNNAFQLEVPDNAASKATEDYTLSSRRKGYTRFVTQETKEFLRRQIETDEMESRALAEVNRKIFAKFSSKRNVWDPIIDAIGFIDALVCLHDYSFGLDEETSCFPSFEFSSNKPFLKIIGGRHPIVTAINAADSFIPNDFQLDDRLAILTGANMGGKSTLMRQTALLCILAQVGCRVPAQQMSLTPVDRIFTRIGAADNIFERESTFFVELAETTMIMKHANIHSLVLIDELGRGTTTFDGCAIAHSVSKNLMRKGCRIMFSTHYHELTREYENLKDVLIYHMSVLEPEESDELEDEKSTITFLYTVAEGPCSKSHGFNAARLAGLPNEIIEKGKCIANQFEQEQKSLLELSEILKAN